VRDEVATLPSGRALAYTDIGADDWPCVFFFHGAPSSRLHMAYLEQTLTGARVRVISPDRPGYGGSSPQPGRSMTDWPSDVAGLADALGVDSFTVAGHSSGGPYAVACAALLPDRVVAGIVFGGVTDMGWPGAWDGYPGTECEIMRLPDEMAAVAWCEQRYGPDGSGFFETSDLELGEPDHALLEDHQTGPVLTSAFTEAFRQGVGGYAQDVLVQGRPWPFHPPRIAVPFHIVHGELDTLLPIAHSRHTSKLIPGSQLHVPSGHGHLTTLSDLPAYLAAT
jgi:pimeloyl-ACP methyl ester carboxylesterase